MFTTMCPKEQQNGDNLIVKGYCFLIETFYEFSFGGILNGCLKSFKFKPKKNKHLSLTLNRPAYVDMCILDLSKTLMYDFHCNYIKKKYDNRARLLFTDTDSLTYEIESEDVYKDFWNDKDMFDHIDYPESSPYYCNVNKKIIAKFKYEACGILITEFIG